MKSIGCGILLVLVLIVLVVGGMLWKSYNGLVTIDQRVNTAWANVQTQYQRRYDLIPNLVNTVAGAANFEKSTLTEVTNARASVGSVKIDPTKAPTDTTQMQQFEAAQTQLGGALSRLLVVAENYPQLRATENFQSLQVQIEGTENRIGASRQDYNEVVQTYNTMVRRFPTVLIAGMLGFNPRPPFSSQAGAEKAPTVNFNFGSPSPAPAATGTP